MSRELKVEIVGDASSLSRAFGSAAKTSDGFGSKLGSVTKAAALLGGAAGLGGLAIVMKTGIGEFMESSKVAAQTEAVLKSTGGAARITAGEVDTLATSLMKKSGVDDEAIKSGENMLLTFTNIRNEAGKGNDVFNQTTQTMLDMSVALGQDTKNSAMQLGKALNDPIKGMTALQRVGVSFTEDQKAQVAAMVKTGDTMGAQKLILGELNKEFGGSAQAAGKTLPGQLAILRETFNNVAGDIVAKLMPAFQRFVAWISERMPQIEAALRRVFDVIGSQIPNVVGAFKKLAEAGEAAFGFVQRNKTLIEVLAGAIGGIVVALELWSVASKVATAAQIALDVAMDANPIGIIVVAIAALVGGLVVLYEKNEKVRNAVNLFGSDCKEVFDDIMRVAKPIIAVLVAEVMKIAKVVQDVVTLVDDVVHGRWDKVWGDLKTLAADYVKALLGYLTGVPGLFLSAAGRIGSAMVSGVVNFVKDLPGKVMGFAVDTGRGFIKGISSGLSGLAAALERLIVGPLNAVISAWNSLSIPSFHVHIAIPAAPDIDFSTPSIGLPDIPQLAEGGIVNRPTIAMIGEAGPEAIVPLSRYGGGRGDVHVHVNVAGALMGSTPKELGETLMPHVRDALKRDGRRNIGDL